MFVFSTADYKQAVLRGKLGPRKQFEARKVVCLYSHENKESFY